MKKASALHGREGRLVHCNFGGGAALWMCVLLTITSLGSKVGAELSPDGRHLLNFLQDNTLVLDHSLAFASWNASEDTPCDWVRVFCNPESAVRRLDLSSCTVSALPDPDPSLSFFVRNLNLSQLGYLRSLQELDMSSNREVGGNGDDFQSLTGLTWLDLSGSYFRVGGYSDILPALPSLQYLHADETAWSGVFIQSFGGMRELLVVSLANNFEGDTIPKEVGNLTQLKNLDLSSNSFIGGIPSLEGLTRLTQLSIRRNQLSGDVPTAPNLQYLDAAENNLSSLTHSFFQMSALKQVNLSRNQFVGQLPDMRLKLKLLDVLDLSWNGLQGPIPSGLGNVTHLDLSHNNLSGPIPQDIRTYPLSNVYGSVDLSGNALNGSIPASLLYGAHFLNLSRNSLAGNIPGAPGGLEVGLYGHVDLSDNQLDGPLTLSFLRLAPRVLWLQNNSFSGDLIIPLTQASMYNFNPNTIRVQGNSFTGDITQLLSNSGMRLHSYLMTVFDLSHNRLNMTPSHEFPDPLRSLLDMFCGDKAPIMEFRLAGSDLMGQQFPDSFQCPTLLRFLQILDLASLQHERTISTLRVSNVESSLTFLNMSNNRLSGPLPEMLPDTITVLDLSNNNLVSEGGMPPDLFTGLRNLVHFNASTNRLSGPIPGTFPPTLRVLDLSHNNLTGPIPGNVFYAFLHLEYINLSGNNLSGVLPDDLSPAVFNARSFADNPGLCGGPLPACAPPTPLPPTSRINVRLLVAVVVVAVLVSTGSCLLLVWTWRVYSKKHQQDADLIATLLERETVTVMPLRQLRRPTSNFSESAQIGVGGFGTVYTGKLADGTRVAIKKGKREGSPEYKQQFLNEVKILSGVNHRHLVKLLGCSMENKIALLVFEFVPNGTLLEHLQGKREGFSPLTWRQRLLIALQTSDALAYLHSAADPPIFHRDVKSSNILLDDDLNTKVADFGISKLAPNKAATHVSTVAVQGTMGYIDPEYYVSFQLTPKSDVYSFGVVLLELISAKPAVDFGRGYDEASLASLAFSAMDGRSWEGLIDPALADTYSLASGKVSIESVGALAVRCLALKSRDRPDMREVRKVLQTVWLHTDSEASDYVSHDLQAQYAYSDVHVHPQQSSQSSQYSTSSTISGPEIEMSSLLSPL